MSPNALVLRSASLRCVLPLGQVRETMRPLGHAPIAGAPAFVLGVSVVRGEPTPVVHLGALLGEVDPTPPGRYVSLRLPSRPVVLAVDEVVGLFFLGAGGPPPPLLGHAFPAALATVRSLDGEVAVVLEATRVLPPDFTLPGTP